MNAASVLAIEDDDIDIRTLKRAFERRGLSERLHLAKDGLEALELLKAGDYALPRPCVVLLDLNLPRMSGLEFLERLKSDPRLPPVEVYLVTMSRDQGEQEAARRLGARAFLLKEQLGSDLAPLFDLLQSHGQLSPSA